MNRLNKLFDTKKDLLSVYFTAGFPQLNHTTTILQSLQDAGVDFVEIGMPFSDPLADGPVIQKSSTQALANGMSLQVLFQQLAQMRQSITMPVILMGYLNPVLKFGVERFIDKCAEVGVDGLILPDLPFELYNEKYRELFESRHISNTFLITPQTPPERVKMLDENANNQFQLDYFNRIKAMELKSPRIVGFGISDHSSYRQVCQYANGAIIGSAFIKMVEKSKDLPGDIKAFVASIKG
ncbi:MAG: tryptophan synthase subunit alpha [Bacteroidales bacterium]|nr:tryptophan synthase subunit alpha [Bacteroidales bacterium]